MKRVIWKFRFDVTDKPKITMPVGARILCVNVQGGQPYVWAEIDNVDAAEIPTETRRFRMLGTGHEFDPGEAGRYIGTFLMHEGYLVFHMYEA